jgi:hypothetical protein
MICYAISLHSYYYTTIGFPFILFSFILIYFIFVLSRVDYILLIIMSNLSLPNAEPSSTNSSTHNRFTKKDQKERRYEQLFPSYHPRKSYVIHFINSLTTEEELKTLCNIIQCSTDFIFDTESDFGLRISALIQVLIVKEDPESSLVLLIETTHLPDLLSSRFQQIQNLFLHLFSIVRSTLYIGLKSQDFKDYYEQLLPVNLFV